MLFCIRLVIRSIASDPECMSTLHDVPEVCKSALTCLEHGRPRIRYILPIRFGELLALVQGTMSDTVVTNIRHKFQSTV